jgi:chaperonin cofactor prefoldin
MYNYEQMISLVDELSSLLEKLRIVEQISEALSDAIIDLDMVRHDLHVLQSFIYSAYAEKDNAVKTYSDKKEIIEGHAKSIQDAQEVAQERLDKVENQVITLETLLDSETFSRSNLSSLRSFLVDRMIERDRSVVHGGTNLTKCEL